MIHPKVIGGCNLKFIEGTEAGPAITTMGRLVMVLRPVILADNLQGPSSLSFKCDDHQAGGLISVSERGDIWDIVRSRTPGPM